MLRKNDCLGKIGEDGAAEIDVEKLSTIWRNPAKLTLLDGHLAHYIPVDALIVVRCDPNELRVRLAEIEDILKRKFALMLRLKC